MTGVSADAVVVRPAARLRGELRLPGDKSISHRALMLALLAAGESRIAGAGDGADVRSTAGIVRGARGTTSSASGRRRRRQRVVPSWSSPGADGLTRARGRPRLRQLRHEPAAGRRDPRRAALPARPRRRRFVAPPSGGSYHRATALDGRGAPRSTNDARRRSPWSDTPRSGRSTTRRPVPSAQVKSAILLAALRAEGRTTVREAVATRDHTERMLRARGVPVERGGGRTGRRRRDESRRRDGGAGGRRAGAGRRLRGGLLAGRGRDPSRRRADAPRRRRQPDPPRGHRPAAPRWARSIEERPARCLGADRRRRRRADGRPRRALVATCAAIDLGPRDVAAAIDEIPVLCLAATQAARHDHDPRRRRAAPQGIRPDRRDRGRPARAGRPGRGRRRRHRDPRPDARSAARRPTASTTTGWR